MSKISMMFVFSALIMSSIAQAAWETVPKDQVYKYRTAIKSKLYTLSANHSSDENRFACFEKIGTLVGSTSEVQINRSGSQPAINLRSTGNESYVSITINTNQDYTEIKSAYYETFYLEQIVSGTLLDPKLSREYVSRYGEGCDAKK